MTVISAIEKYSDIEVDLLLSHILGKPKEFLYVNPNYSLTTKQFNNLVKLAERRQKGEPIAYLVGYKYFCGLKFYVSRNVLIPRPETELLVDKALERIKKPELRIKKVLDVGTGSGNIIISLATLILRSIRVKYYASDISVKALYVAEGNAKLHKAKINFIRSDLFNEIPGKVDLIIANLPYVSISDYKKLRAGLQYEPKQALTDNTNEWKIYQQFLSQVTEHLNPGASIILEIDPKAKPFINRYQKKFLPGAKLKFFKDFRGFWRYVEIK